MGKMQKMYFFDIDGTLAYSGKKLHPAIVNLLTALINKDSVGKENVVIVTGTPLNKALEQLTRPIVDTGIKIFASMGGIEWNKTMEGVEWEPKTGKISVDDDKGKLHRPIWNDPTSLFKLSTLTEELNNHTRDWEAMRLKVCDLQSDLEFLVRHIRGNSNKLFPVCPDDTVNRWNTERSETDFIEYRPGMVTFRTVAANAKLSVREAFAKWEPNCCQRSLIANFLSHRHRDFYFTVSGKTSIDILEKKYNAKGQFIGQKDEVLDFLKDDIDGKKLVFVADETQSNENGIGNDHLLAEAILRRKGVVYTVTPPNDPEAYSDETRQFLENEFIAKV